MSKRIGIISIILAASLFLVFELKDYAIANADISNNNNPDNSVGLKIPLPFSSHHVAVQTTDDEKKYIDNILPFP